MATNNYIVRQPIKNTKSQVIGHEILYYGEDELYSGLGGASAPNSAASEFAVADAIYNFLTQNSQKAFKGSLNFMTFTTTLLMKKVQNFIGIEYNETEVVNTTDDNTPLEANDELVCYGTEADFRKLCRHL